MIEKQKKEKAKNNSICYTHRKLKKSVKERKYIKVSVSINERNISVHKCESILRTSLFNSIPVVYIWYTTQMY